MTRGLPFVKMSGAGNDFVLVEAGSLPRGARLPALARRLCSRRRSIGADGLLVVSRGRTPFLDYYNADGSRAFCANGSRCGAWWYRARAGGSRAISFDSLAGRIDAVIAGPERVSIRMPMVERFSPGLKLQAAGRTWTVHAVTVGVPHAVVETTRLESLDVVGIGRAMRRHRAFGKAGANVNFLQRTARGPVRIRTYERGVEDETLACGTGATAAAVCLHRVRGTRSPIRLQTRGGDVLTVRFRPVNGGVEDLWLEGPARITFEGVAPR